MGEEGLALVPDVGGVFVEGALDGLAHEIVEEGAKMGRGEHSESLDWKFEGCTCGLLHYELALAGQRYYAKLLHI
jgi:hypothetical protein